MNISSGVKVHIEMKKFDKHFKSQLKVSPVTNIKIPTNTIRFNNCFNSKNKFTGIGLSCIFSGEKLTLKFELIEEQFVLVNVCVCVSVSVHV